MEDVRHVAIQERNYMILKAICDINDPRALELYRKLYEQEDFYLSYAGSHTNRSGPDGFF